MKYEITSIAQLKAAIFDAIEKGVVLDKVCLAYFETFESSVGDYIEMCRNDAAIKPTLYPKETTLLDWYEELTGTRPVPAWQKRVNRA